MAEGEDPNLPAQRYEAVQRHEPRCTEGNHQFADIAVGTATDQRMFGKQRDSRGPGLVPALFRRMLELQAPLATFDGRLATAA